MTDIEGTHFLSNLKLLSKNDIIVQLRHKLPKSAVFCLSATLFVQSRRFWRRIENGADRSVLFRIGG
jgi:hypothetical protein